MRSFEGALIPVIVAFTHTIYIVVMGWVGPLWSIVTIRGVQIVRGLRRPKAKKPKKVRPKKPHQKPQ